MSKFKTILSMLFVLALGFLLIACNETDDNPVPETYTVTFNVDGGSEVSAQTVEKGSKATKPLDPTKANYTFVEWQLDGVKYQFTETVEADITLTAIWQAEAVVTYTVTFDSDGGTAVATQTVNKGSKATMPTAPTKANHTFVEWQLNGITYTFNETVEGNITLKAIWVEVEPEEDFEVTITIKATLPINTPEDADIYISGDLKNSNVGSVWSGADVLATKDGLSATVTLTYLNSELPLTIEYKWTRGDWANVEKDENGDELAGNRTLTITETTTINDVVETWADNPVEPEPEPEVFTVTFNVDGGSVVVAQEVEEGNKVNEPANPTKEGYTFVEWQLEGVKYDFDDAVTKDITLVAIWLEDEVEPEPEPKVFTVTFNADGGTLVAAQEVLEGEKALEPAEPTKEGFTFVEWQLDGVKYDFDALVTKDLTLVAIWLEDEVEPEPEPEVFTVTFNTDGGSVVVAQEVEEGNKVLEPENPTKEGYTFVEWQLDGVKYDFDDAVTKDLTLLAIWLEDEVEPEPEPEVYTVTFNVDGGSVVGTQEVEEGNKVNEPANPTKDGFTFVEWQLDGVKYDFDDVVTKDITLVAIWLEDEVEPEPEPEVFTVSFNADGGTLVAAQEVEEGAKALEPAEPTKEGYTFVEWQLDGVKYDFDTEVTKDITLVAIWLEDEVEPEPEPELIKLNPPLHGFGVSAHPDYHMGIGPYAEGGQEGFIGFGFVFTHNTTGVKYNWLVASNYNTGMAYWANAENLGQQGIVLPFGIYKVEYFARGNGTTHSDSDVSGAFSTMTVPKPNLAPFTININDQVVTWDAVANASSYAIYVNGLLEDDNATSPFDLTSIVDPGEYVIKVVASAEDFNSSEAPTKTFIIAGDAPQLSTPDNLVADGFNLTWDAVENAVSYNVTLDGVTVNVNTTSYDLSKFDKANQTLEVSVIAVGNIVDFSDSEAGTLEVTLGDLLPRLNALNTGNFVATYILNGVDGGHRKLEIYDGHPEYNQEGYTKVIRLGIKVNGQMIYQDFNFTSGNMQMIHTPGSTSSFFGKNLPASGTVELHFILVGDGVIARDSLPLITTMNWSR